MTDSLTPTRERDVEDAPRGLRGCAVEGCTAPFKALREQVPYCEEHLPLLLDAAGRPTKEGWRAIGRAFQKPLPYKERPGGGGKRFKYIDARQVAALLDSVVGPGNWSTDWQCLRAEHPVAVRFGLAVFGVWKWDAGYSNNPDADDETDKAYEDEPLKAAVSDGFKRAAVQWGIGRFLYGDV